MIKLTKNKILEISLENESKFFYKIDEVINQLEFVSDCEIINIDPNCNPIWKKCKFKYWSPEQNELCYFFNENDEFSILAKYNLYDKQNKKHYAIGLTDEYCFDNCEPYGGTIHELPSNLKKINEGDYDGV